MAADRELMLLSRRILKILGMAEASLDIFLLPHEEIKALKAKFIKKQTEPNVLAFPEPEQFPHPERRQATRDNGQGKKIKFLGEVYLNADILKESPERTAPLLLHGMLHLLGYDHIKKKDAPKMEAMERRVLKML